MNVKKKNIQMDTNTDIVAKVSITKLQVNISYGRQLAIAFGAALLFLLVLGNHHAFGQDKDTLIAQDGKVYTGHYNKPVFGHSSFTINGKKQPLDPKTALAYKHDGTWFKSVQLAPSADPVWMQMLERGAIELYQYISYGAATRVSPRNMPESYVVWLASKNNGPLLNVNGVMSTEIRAKENLHRLLADQPELAAAVQRDPFNTRVIRELIAAYNRQALEGQAHNQGQ